MWLHSWAAVARHGRHGLFSLFVQIFFVAQPRAAMAGTDPLGVRLAVGARIDEADQDGRTALWLAARHSKLGVSWTLILSSL